MERINVPGAPPALGPYSHAVRDRDRLYLSGQIALDSEGSLIEGDVVAQTHQVMQNIGGVLLGSYCSYDDVLHASIYLRNQRDFQRVNEAYGGYFQEGRHPARTCVVASAPKDKVDIEIGIIARVPLIARVPGIRELRHHRISRQMDAIKASLADS